MKQALLQFRLVGIAQVPGRCRFRWKTRRGCGGMGRMARKSTGWPAAAARKCLASKSKLETTRIQSPQRAPAPSPRRWRAAELRRLGKQSDEVVAHRLGRTLNAVKVKRLLQGIPDPDGPRSRWTPQVKALLGTMTDRQLAGRLKFAVVTVWAARKRFGIPAFAPRKTWTRREEALLGKHTDRYVERRLGRGLGTAILRRLALGIARFIPPAARWTPQQDALLGKLSDYEIARRLHRNSSTVCRRRQRLGIPRWRPAPFWTPRRVALLGKHSDAELGRRFGRSAAALCQRRQRLGIPSLTRSAFTGWTPRRDALLGKYSDQELARRLQASAAWVWHRRRRLGIAACGSGAAIEQAGQLRRLRVLPVARWQSWTSGQDALLGKYSDRALGRKLKVCVTTVGNRRQKLGIPAFKPSARPPLPSC